jgi:hypothetical protein
VRVRRIAAAAYSHAQLQRVRATCLYIATKLGDLLDDAIVVGGLVPSLIFDQKSLKAGASSHLGTLDLDLGLALALLEGERYRTLSDRLREAGFAADINPRVTRSGSGAGFKPPAERTLS